MLAKLDVRYVIAGHSERRELFGETDEQVNAKVHAILKAGMTPILCCGETLEEREAGGTEEKVTGQVQAGLAKVSAAQVGGLVIAYEPIWAIGTGRTASAEDAQAVCGLVRATVGRVAGQRGGRVGAGPVRRLGEADQRQGAHGPARHRRRPGGRGQPRGRRLRPNRAVPPLNRHSDPGHWTIRPSAQGPLDGSTRTNRQQGADLCVGCVTNCTDDHRAGVSLTTSAPGAMTYPTDPATVIRRSSRSRFFTYRRWPNEPYGGHPRGIPDHAIGRSTT